MRIAGVPVGPGFSAPSLKEPSFVKNHLQEITVHPPAGSGWDTVQGQLESAAEDMRLVAMAEKRHGILVTRHRQHTFTVAISPEVPYGMTYERDEHVLTR
nr:hypothetical protein [Arthrobacter mobilis]